MNPLAHGAAMPPPRTPLFWVWLPFFILTAALAFAACYLAATPGHPALAAVVAAWPTLPDPIRRAVMALVGTVDISASAAGTQ